MTKYKQTCDVCGRKVRNQLKIPFGSEEKLLCSFCIKKEKERIAKIKDQKRRYIRQAKPCANCGKIAILVKRTTVCAECYFKNRFPNATKIEEVSGEVFCPVCGKIFEKTHYRRKYCSRECFYKRFKVKNDA